MSDPEKETRSRPRRAREVPGHRAIGMASTAEKKGVFLNTYEFGILRIGAGGLGLRLQAKPHRHHQDFLESCRAFVQGVTVNCSLHHHGSVVRLILNIPSCICGSFSAIDSTLPA